MLTKVTPAGYTPTRKRPDLDMEDLDAIANSVSYQQPMKRSRNFPTVDTSARGTGVGVQRSGYNLPPVALPGLTQKEKSKIATQLQQTLAAPSPRVKTPMIQSPSKPAVDPRFGVAAKGVASVVGPAILEAIAKKVPGRRTDASDFLNAYGNLAAFIPGLGPYAYLLTSLGGPFLDILIASAEAQAKNQMIQGAMTAPVGFEEYAEFLKNNPDANLTLDEYKKYKEDLKKYENTQKSCRRVTQDMLGDMTLEEYAAENGIDIKDESEDTGPPQYKKFTPDEIRQPTQEEIEILKDIRLM